MLFGGRFDFSDNLARTTAALWRRGGFVRFDGGGCRRRLGGFRRLDGQPAFVFASLFPHPASRFGARHGRRQRLQQGFAIIARIGFGARGLIPIRLAVAAVALPVTPVTIAIALTFLGTIFLRALGTRTVVALATIIAGTIVARATIIALALLSTVIPRTVITGAVITRAVVTEAFITLTLLRAVITLPVTARALLPVIAHALAIAAGIILARTAIIDIVAAVIAVGAVVVTIQAIVIVTVAATAGVGLAITIIAEQAEIMFGILQIIFGGHPIAGLLRIAGQGAIFFQQLGGIAALAIVEPRAIIVATSHLLRARSIVAATPTPPLVVSDQDRDPRSWPCLRPLWVNFFMLHLPSGSGCTPGLRRCPPAVA